MRDGSEGYRSLGEKIAVLKRRMNFLAECDENEKALEVLAELVEMGCRDRDIIWAGAKNYFAVGDLARAAKWTDMMLGVTPDHVGARLLLAKLCLMENRVWEALAIYDFVAKNLYGRMNADERQEMQDILMDCAEKDKYTVAFYPNAVDFLVREYNRTELLSVVKWLDENRRRI